MSGGEKKILIHTCCAACASFLGNEFEKDGYQSVLYYYNPNYNHLDYHFRLGGVQELAAIGEHELVVPVYNPDEYASLIAPYHDKFSIKFINDPERLIRRDREILTDLLMSQTADYAKANRIKTITTAMLCSPYRDHNQVWDAGARASEQRKLAFYYKDFRKGYWMGRNIARRNNLAIPAYCSDYLE